MGETVVQFSSVAQSCPALCNPMNRSTPGLPVHHSLLEFTQTHVHWVGDAIQPPHPLSSPSPPALNLSQHQGFSNESVIRIRWPKHWSFSFSIRPSNEYSGLISFRLDWQDLLAVQGTLESLLQHHSSKASILLCSAFFIVQFSHPYMRDKFFFFFFGLKITADGDCSHEIKRCFLFGRKVMTNLDSILKSRDLTLPTKVHLVKAKVFPVVMYCSDHCTKVSHTIFLVSQYI